MFAIRRNDGKFYCVPGSGSIWRKFKDCTNPWIHYYPSVLNRQRNRLRRMYTKRKIKVVELTPSQLEFLTFLKLKGH